MKPKFPLAYWIESSEKFALWIMVQMSGLPTWNFTALSILLSGSQVESCQARCKIAPPHEIKKKGRLMANSMPMYTNMETKTTAKSANMGRTQDPNRRAVDLTPAFASSRLSWHAYIVSYIIVQLWNESGVKIAFCSRDRGLERDIMWRTIQCRRRMEEGLYD